MKTDFDADQSKPLYGRAFLKRPQACQGSGKLSQYATNSEVAAVDHVPHAWVEALEDGFIFIGTTGRIAGFSRRKLPSRWSDHFKAPEGNLTLAQKIDRHGSTAETPLDQVARLDWPPLDLS